MNNQNPYQRGAMGPPLNTNLKQGYYGYMHDGFDNRPQMPQVNSPCDLSGPLARGSNWPYEVLIYPEGARPAYGASFNLYQEVEVAVAGTFVDVVSIQLDQSEEGRILEWAGTEEGATGSDLFWRIIKDGSAIARLDVMRGGWSDIMLPQKIVVPIPSGSRISLQVSLPSGSATPRTVRGLIRGWAAPFDGGGTFKGGFGRS